MKDIQTLLDRYWEGETTLEEERRLKDFFAAEPVPEQFTQEAQFFRALRSEQSVQLPQRPAYSIHRLGLYRWAAAASVALLLGAGFWWWSVQPNPVLPQPIADTQPAQPAISVVPAPGAPSAEKISADNAAKTTIPPSPRKKEHRQVHNPAPAPSVADTYQDPEQALAEIKAALALVSSKIKKGKKEVDKGLQEIEMLDQAIKKRQDG